MCFVFTQQKPFRPYGIHPSPYFQPTVLIIPAIHSTPTTWPETAGRPRITQTKQQPGRHPPGDSLIPLARREGGILISPPPPTPPTSRQTVSQTKTLAPGPSHGFLNDTHFPALSAYRYQLLALTQKEGLSSCQRPPTPGPVSPCWLISPCDIHPLRTLAPTMPFPHPLTLLTI